MNQSHEIDLSYPVDQSRIFTAKNEQKEISSVRSCQEKLDHLENCIFAWDHGSLLSWLAIKLLNLSVYIVQEDPEHLITNWTTKISLF